MKIYFLKGRNKLVSTIGDLFLGEILIIFLAFLWYDSMLWVIFLQFLLIPYFFFLRESHRKKKERQYEKGFYDFLQSLLPSLQAGYSLENACYTAYEELLEMNGKDHAFVQEMYSLVCGLKVHIPVEKLFHEMAGKTANDDIHQFAVVLEILKNMGGNSVEVLRGSMVRIQKKMETTEEIRTLLSGKIYEKNLMLFMPFFMVLYLRITNPSYLDALYHTRIGQGVLSVALLCIIVCFYWGESIMKPVTSWQNQGRSKNKSIKKHVE